MASTIRISILANGTQAKREFKDVSKAAEKSIGRFKDLGKSIAGVGSTLAGIGSLMGPATTGILALAKAVAALGKTLGATAASAVAFAPSVIGAIGLVQSSVSLALPGIASAFDPIIERFTVSGKKMGVMAQNMRDIGAEGLKPLVKEFARVNLDEIETSMMNIALATNGVVKSTLKWINTAEGQRLINMIAVSTQEAMFRLEPKISAAAIALGRLANRAGDKAITGLARVIERILDKFIAWANSTSAADIQKNLDSLASFGRKVKDAFIFLRDIGRWMKDNKEKVKALSDSFAVLGIALAVFAGGPVMGAIAGAFTLLVNHWNDAKVAFQSATTWWDQTWAALNANANFAAFRQSISDFINAILPPLKSMWDQIVQEVTPKIQALKDTIMNEVLPALTAFIDAMRPIVAFLLEKLGPVVAQTFGIIVILINSALKVIAGIFNIFAGILSGNWGKVWEGIKQILRAAWDLMVAIVKGAWVRLKAAVDIGLAALGKVLSGLPGKIKGWVGDLGGVLANAGKELIHGFVKSIEDGFNAVKNTLGRLTGLLPDWKGPAQRDRNLLVKPGQLVMEGFLRGLETQYASIRASLGNFTGSLSVPASASVGLAQSVDLSAQAAAINSKTQVAVTFDASPTGDPVMDTIFEQFRKRIRIQGGNVQAALGR